MEEQKKESIGEASYRLLQKPPEKINVVDMQREMQKNLAISLEETIARHKDIQGKYYIKVMYRKERVVPNAIRLNVIAPYFAKPAPEYDVSLYSFDNSTNELKYYWTIPDEETCQYLLVNASSLPKEEKELLAFVQQFVDGKLDS